MSGLRIYVTVFILLIANSVNAALVSRLGGLAIFDDAADLTWLVDANLAGTTMSWSEANNWAAGLNVAGISGWRLPDTLAPDNSCFFPSGTALIGFNCTGSEMGNLFYNVLGGVEGSQLSQFHNANYDLFSNIQDSGYWSATESFVDRAWAFNMFNGAQIADPQDFNKYAWAVHDGDVGVVPIPITAWLFGTALIGLAGFTRQRKNLKSVRKSITKPLPI